MLKRLVKICCIQNLGEARLALEMGADYLGLITAMPSGPGPIPEDRIAEIIRELPDPAQAVLLTSQTDVEEIVAQQHRTGAGALQLCSKLSVEQIQKLREKLSGIELIPVIHVTGPEAIKTATELAQVADKLLLDSGAPQADVPVLGGTGQTHDWSVSAEIVRTVGVPVFLAGGLKPDNVLEAIDNVNPAGVDICSGLRIDGLLDEVKLTRFMQIVRGA